MNIVLADPHQEVRAALRLVLEQQHGLHVVGEARDTLELIGHITRVCPHAVLLDPELHGLQVNRRAAISSLAELVEIIHQLCPTAQVIALSSQPGAEKACSLAKIEAFFCKSDPPDALLALLEQIQQAG